MSGGLPIIGAMVAADTMRPDELVEHVRRLEALGHTSAWIPDMFGREIYVTAAHLLAMTERINIASGIAHIYGRDAIAHAQAALTLSELSGGRFIQGLGVSHPIAAEMRGLEWENPVEMSRRFLTTMRGELPLSSAADVVPSPVYLAAHGPKMLAVAAECADGANIYMQTPEHLRTARDILGPDRELNLVLPTCLTDDVDAGRAAGRRALSIYLPLPAYQRRWASQGFDDSDWSGTGSDRLIDTFICMGDLDAVQERMAQYVQSGASSIVLAPLPAERRDPSSTWDLLEALAPH